MFNEEENIKLWRKDCKVFSGQSVDQVMSEAASYELQV